MFKQHMHSAIEQARRQQSPFGTVLAMGDQQVVAASDAAADQYDPTGHAIVMALRELGAMSHETTFPGYELYTTTEPCPLCAAACVLARLEAVYFGLELTELTPSRYPGKMRAADVFKSADPPPELKGKILESECRKLL